VIAFLRDHFRREPYPSRPDPWRFVAGRGRGRTWIFATPRAGTLARAGWHDPEKRKPVFRTDHADFDGSDGSSP
jgi:hypothetical protein